MGLNIPLFKIYWDAEDIEMATRSVQRGMSWAVGPFIPEFEGMLSEYMDGRYCLAFSSGTAALHAILIAYGIGDGDEVIVPSFSFIATANAPLFVGAKPVFADIEEANFGLDPEDVRKKITPRTRAIMPMHYGGGACLAGELKRVAEENGLLLIEDAAESFGTLRNGRKVGTFGDAAMFSLCQTKVFTTGEGGVIVTGSREIYEKLKLIRSHGRAETADYYSPEEYMDYVALGYNFRMPDIIAALGISQLKKVDRLIEMRRTNADYLRGLLSGIEDIQALPAPGEVFHVCQEFAVQVKSGRETRDALKNYLGEKGIGTRISFPPIHLTRYYRNMPGYEKVALPVTEKVTSRALTLPMYPSITRDEMDYIAGEIGNFYRGA